MKLLLLVFFFAMASVTVAIEAPLPIPKSWTIRIETSGRDRGIQNLMEVNQFSPGDVELVVRRGPVVEPRKAWKKLYVGNLTAAEAEKIWQAFSESLRQFSFERQPEGRMDGLSISIELQIDSRALKVSFGGIGDLAEVSDQLKQALEMMDKFLTRGATEKTDDPKEKGGRKR